MQFIFKERSRATALTFCLVCMCALAHGQASSNDSMDATGWQMQDATRLPQDGKSISSPSFSTAGWYKATVPGTVLTTLVDNKVYPEPLYGENNRPDKIPESLARTPFWYRTSVVIPRSYAGRHTWLHLDGINYSAAIWVNGRQVGSMRGAFCRGVFDISADVQPGRPATLAVLITPQPHPGTPHEHTLKAGTGQNGGETAIDGPTFMSTIGWDWIPAIRDRDSGLWRKVWLSASGSVIIDDPQVTTDLKVPGFASADVTVHATLRNVTDAPVAGVLKGTIGSIAFEQTVTLAAHTASPMTFDAATFAALHIEHPTLWWPNGYGPQNLHHLHLEFVAGGAPSHTADVTFGIRKITYEVPSTSALAFVVNGVPIFIRGGDWGLDEAMKRIPRERLEAQIRMHQLANLNMIRNWVGQSTSEDFFELCDKYGILVWDEFFQPNPADGPDPTDLETYLDNVRDTVLHYRNHASIVIWCARNEGNPPEAINSAMKSMIAELDPTRLYQANSSDGRSVRSHGPYRWRNPRDFYWAHEGFKSETGSVSIPTLESVQGMMPQRDWETITDDWAEHDLNKGASGGDLYPGVLAARFGAIANLADFVRKAQLANYEDFRAMYEGRNAILWQPATGIVTWMSHPAQPSFVWQLYHYDLEANSSLFAVKSASEMIHIQFNEVSGAVQVINNTPDALRGLTAQTQVYNMNGKLSSEDSISLNAPASAVTYAGGINFHEPLSRVFFIKLRLLDATGKLLSENFYWQTHPEKGDVFTTLNDMPAVELQAAATRADSGSNTVIEVTLQNASANVALMSHIQLRRADNGERVLPAYYSGNYVSLLGGESKTLQIECSTAALQGSAALITVDGWNVTVAPSQAPGVAVKSNENALVSHWPKTGLPFQQY